MLFEHLIPVGKRATVILDRQATQKVTTENEREELYAIGAFEAFYLPVDIGAEVLVFIKRCNILSGDECLVADFHPQCEVLPPKICR